MDQISGRKTPIFSFVICYTIYNLLERTVIEETCSRYSIPVRYTANISELVQLAEPGKALMICDLMNITDEILDSIIEQCTTRNWRALGFFPHVSSKVAEKAASKGVNYVVPKSSFKRRLDQILAN
jgi:hypothetical protein